MARLALRVARFFGQVRPGRHESKSTCTPFDTDFSVFREGDRVIVHGKCPILSKPLRNGQKTDLRRGYLEHDKIIGQSVFESFQAYKGSVYRLSHPTLDEYVSLTPRCVTPIYAADANLIVSLLDIHVAPAMQDTSSAPLEILESGTGHGSLTLHLARAVQAANTAPPSFPSRSQIVYLRDRPRRRDAEVEESASARTAKDEAEESQRAREVDPAQQGWDAWRTTRKAVIHTVDVSPQFSAHAEKIVRGFRRGIYAGNVEFYVGAVENWVDDQIQRRRGAAGGTEPEAEAAPEPFLSYAILDMPSAQLRISHVAPILKRNGVLAVFMPSVTQIGECVELIGRQKLPFRLERVIELGTGISNGRSWDVRYAVKKSRADPSSWAGTSPPVTEKTAPQPSDKEVETDEDRLPVEMEPRADEGVLVCRPMVGLRIVGGGFVGLWRKVRLQEK